MRNGYPDKPFGDDVDHLHIIVFLEYDLPGLEDSQFDGMCNCEFLLIGQTSKEGHLADSGYAPLLLLQFHLLQRPLVKVGLHQQKHTVLPADYRSRPSTSKQQGQLSEGLSPGEDADWFLVDGHFHESSLDEEEAVTQIALLEHGGPLLCPSHHHLAGNRLYFLVIEGGEELVVDQCLPCELQLCLTGRVSRKTYIF